MALIQCRECGQMVSDKAVKCPKCGCPVVRRPVVARPAGATPKRETPWQTRVEQERDTSGVTKILWTVLLMVAVCVGILCWKLFFAKDEAMTADTLDAASSASVSEDASGVAYDDYCAVDTIPAKESIDRAEVVRNAYLEKIREMKRWCTDNDLYNDILCEYFLFDITQNGVPDLWLTYGTCEANKEFRVYTYKHGEMQKLYEDYYGNSGFYAGSDYVIRMSAHMGFSYWCKYTYDNGEMNGVQIYEETTDDEYTEPKEKYIEMTSWDDTAPIERMPVN